MKITRTWAMPNSLTFKIKPIREIIYRHKHGIIVDPFANTSKIGTIRNDLNPAMKTEYNLDALEFLSSLDSNIADTVLFDPPYSISQAAECYNNFGKEKLSVSVSNMAYWAECKNQVSRILKVNGTAVICGWNSNGLGVNRGFKMIELLIVAHGGSKNDTIVTVEKKLQFIRNQSKIEF